MNKAEKQQKFRETLLNIYYPPPQQPESSQQDVEEEQLENLHEESSNVDLISDAFNDSEEEDNSLNDTSDCGSHKLSRAQRKRLRRKKLKEAASQRRKIIGPMLPLETGGEEVADDKEPSGVHTNPVPEMVRSDARELNTGNEQLGESHAKSKLKHRRMGKRSGRTLDCSDVIASHRVDAPNREQDVPTSDA